MNRVDFILFWQNKLLFLSASKIIWRGCYARRAEPRGCYAKIADQKKPRAHQCASQQIIVIPKETNLLTSLITCFEQCWGITMCKDLITLLTEKTKHFPCFLVAHLQQLPSKNGSFLFLGQKFYLKLTRRLLGKSRF